MSCDFQPPSSIFHSGIYSSAISASRRFISISFPHQSPVTSHQELLAPFVSVTYELPILQPFCFHIHACNGGMGGVFGIPAWTCSSDLRFFGQLLSFDTLPHSFALIKNSTLFFSSKSELFPKNTRGWGTPHFSAGNKMNQTTNNSSSSHDTLRRFHRHPTRSRASPLPRFTSQRDKCLLDYIHPILHMAGLRGHLPLSTRGPRS